MFWKKKRQDPEELLMEDFPPAQDNPFPGEDGATGEPDRDIADEFAEEDIPLPEDCDTDGSYTEKKRRGLLGFVFNRKKQKKDLETLRDLTSDIDHEVSGENFLGTSTQERNKGAEVVLNNLTSVEWLSPILFTSIYRKMRNRGIRLLFLGAVLCAVVGGGYATALVFNTKVRGDIDAELNISRGKNNEYRTILNNMKLYDGYAAIKVSPSIAMQFGGVMLLAMDHRILLSEMSFAREVPAAIRREVGDAFPIEYGRTLDSVKIHGVWTISGMLSPSVRDEGVSTDNTWLMNFSSKAIHMFRPADLNSYVYMHKDTRGDASLNLTIILWK